MRVHFVFLDAVPARVACERHHGALSSPLPQALVAAVLAWPLAPEADPPAALQPTHLRAPAAGTLSRHGSGSAASRTCACLQLTSQLLDLNLALRAYRSRAHFVEVFGEDHHVHYNNWRPLYLSLNERAIISSRVITWRCPWPQTHHPPLTPVTSRRPLHASGRTRGGQGEALYRKSSRAREHRSIASLCRCGCLLHALTAVWARSQCVPHS